MMQSSAGSQRRPVLFFAMSGGSALWPADDDGDPGLAEEIRESLAEFSDALFLKEGPMEVEFAKALYRDLESDTLETEEELDHLLLSHTADIREGESSMSTGSSKEQHSEQVILPGANNCVQETAHKSLPVGRFFILRPSFGWGELMITEHAMLALLAAIGVFKQFFRYLKVFGLKPFARDEGLGGFDYLETLTDGGLVSQLETCYLLKYVQRRDSAGPKAYPWSLRHSLIYQNVNLNTQTIDHILIRPPDTMDQRLAHAVGKTPEARKAFLSDWSQIHSMSFESVDGSFRDCINQLDEEVSKLFDRVIISGIEAGKLREFDTLDQSVRDIKTLQFLADQARRVKQAVEVNIDTIELVRTAMGRIRKSKNERPSPYDGNALVRLDDRLADCRSKHRSNRRSILAVSKRAEALSQQLRDTVALRNGELSRSNMEETRRNTSATFDLSEKSGQEAHVLKILTVLALVFAPAGYAADFLQMGYINVADNEFEVTATAGLQLYAAIALPLVSTTMIIYGFVEYGKRRMADKTMADKVSCV
ncbi:hypothetical protein LX36DRAFT_704992 [Colletotrichum falcatum]|nr:hypothetical protein LX36DRAFT_704992 [Colletotrichum falcatum]